MASDRERNLARKLKSILPRMAGLARESVLYKINRLEEPPIFCYSIENVITKGLFENQIDIECRLLDGYKRIRSEITDPAIDTLVDLSSKKIFFYKKLENVEFSGKYDRCEKIFGRLTLELCSLELDPCNDAKIISIYINREHRGSYSADSLPITSVLDLDAASIIEIMILCEQHNTLFGIIMLPTAFFIERPDQLLHLSFDRFNFINIQPKFHLTRILRRDKIKNHFAMIEGHSTEKVTASHLVYCTLCGGRCDPLSLICVCLKCNMKVHVPCIDFIMFCCRADNRREDDCYSIAHQFEGHVSSGLRYCTHCGERIALGTACTRCTVCHKNFHSRCSSFAFDTCGLSFELLQKIAELEALRNFNMEIGTKTTIKDFELLGSIGRGAMGRVIEARHKGDNKILAIKAIPKHRIRSFKTLTSVKTEITVLKRMQDFKCPFIVEMNYSFEDNYYIYIGMEYYRAGDLFTNPMHGELPEEQIRLYAAELILALEHLHANGIIHQDLKLENVILTKEGHTKLCDFGTALIGVSYEEVLQTYYGTLQIAPPEAVEGRGYTFSADFWSLGVLLYELFHKVSPFAGRHTCDFMKAICTQEVAITADISEEAKDFLKKLLIKEASARLGHGSHGAEKIKAHRWFGSLDWDAVQKREIRPLYIPEIKKSDRREIRARLTPVIAVPDLHKYIHDSRKEEQDL